MTKYFTVSRRLHIFLTKDLGGEVATTLGLDRCWTIFGTRWLVAKFQMNNHQPHPPPWCPSSRAGPRKSSEQMKFWDWFIFNRLDYICLLCWRSWLSMWGAVSLTKLFCCNCGLLQGLQKSWWVLFNIKEHRYFAEGSDWLWVYDLCWVVALTKLDNNIELNDIIDVRCLTWRLALSTSKVYGHLGDWATRWCYLLFH